MRRFFFGEAGLQLSCIMTARVNWTAIAMAACFQSNFARADDAVDLKAAAQQFMNSCGVCHTVEPGAEIRQGPNLATAFGRTAGTLAEFPAYSEVLKKAGAGGLAWTEETLDKWISSATDYLPGVSMMYAQPDAAKRKLIIAYLKGLPAGGNAAPAK